MDDKDHGLVTNRPSSLAIERSLSLPMASFKFVPLPDEVMMQPCV